MPFSDIARAAELRLYRDTIPALKARGWRPRVVAYDGYGSAGGEGSMARVLARMVMRPPDAPAEGPLFRSIPEELPTSAQAVREVALDTLLDAQRGWRQFIDVPVPYLPVTITVGSVQVRTRADRRGYVDVVVRDHGLEPGWQDVIIDAAGAGEVTTRVNVIAPGRHLGIVSDIDDTAMVTDVPRIFLAAWNLLIKNASNREPVPGMADLLEKVRSAHPDTPVIFLSTGAWNAVPTLRAFFRKNGFPEAPKLMTDWGPTNTGWFRSGIEHKRTELRRLMIDLPDLELLLIGDDGQHDPLIYSEVVREHSDRVAAVAIRQLSEREQVLAGSQLAHPMGLGPEARTLAEADVPVVVGRDGYELARLLPTWITQGDGSPVPDEATARA
ncbi:App1 family protein [Actinomyces haliotis]|uniref:App1 family protein n=1 Tax=Actinomyces haliotis TaxID=1280843 RepID=UPI00188E6B85|nr:phosphatase domain-containing protein [Actinomyces haliotis]